jgi:hypothetical protein
MQTVASGLKKSLPSKLVDELLEAYEEAKQNFYVGGLRLSAVRSASSTILGTSGTPRTWPMASTQICRTQRWSSPCSIG